MNNNSPVGNASQLEFTQKALDTKFSYSFTRKQCIILFKILNELPLKLGELDSIGMETLNEIRVEIKKTAISSITESDYVTPSPMTNHVDKVTTT